MVCNMAAVVIVYLVQHPDILHSSYHRQRLHVSLLYCLNIDCTNFFTGNNNLFEFWERQISTDFIIGGGNVLFAFFSPFILKSTWGLNKLTMPGSFATSSASRKKSLWVVCAHENKTSNLLNIPCILNIYYYILFYDLWPVKFCHRASQT